MKELSPELAQLIQEANWYSQYQAVAKEASWQSLMTGKPIVMTPTGPQWENLRKSFGLHPSIPVDDSHSIGTTRTTVGPDVKSGSSGETIHTMSPASEFSEENGKKSMSDNKSIQVTFGGKQGYRVTKVILEDGAERFSVESSAYKYGAVAVLLPWAEAVNHMRAVRDEADAVVDALESLSAGELPSIVGGFAD